MTGYIINLWCQTIFPTLCWQTNSIESKIEAISQIQLRFFIFIRLRVNYSYTGQLSQTASCTRRSSSSVLLPQLHCTFHIPLARWEIFKTNTQQFIEPFSLREHVFNIFICEKHLSKCPSDTGTVKNISITRRYMILFHRMKSLLLNSFHHNFLLFKLMYIFA